MDSDELVRKISSEVIQRLGNDPSPGPRSAAGAAMGVEGRRALILLTGGDTRLDDVLATVEQIVEQSASADVVLSPSAARIIGVPALRRVVPEARVHTEGDVWELLDRAEMVLLPCLSLNGLAKIAGLQPDSLVCILAVYGMLRGLPVVVSRDCVLPARIDRGRVPRAVQARIDGLLGCLEEMGVTVCSLTEMASARATGAPAVPATGAGESSSCSQKAGDECGACGGCVEKRPAAVAGMVTLGADRVAATTGARPASPEMARKIDHTLLAPDTTEDQIRELCAEALQHVFASVCVNPSWVSLCAQLLAGSPVKVCTVIGFPLGATTPTTKAIETRDAIANGATEIDMVINVGALKSGDDDLVRRDIQAVVDAARGGAIVKVILETALLHRDEKVRACLLAKLAGADFVKTSTGFGPGGATTEDIALMRKTVGPEMGVKASGGIRDRETADAMVAAGATRIGASASVAIATGTEDHGTGY